MLIEMMEQGIDSINDHLLGQCLIANSEVIIPEIISKLKENTSDFFVETAIRVLYGVKNELFKTNNGCI